MRVLFLPVFRVSLGYSVTFGRRWSVLEHLLLVDLSETNSSVAQLSARANLPERLVVEALINLMRASWIEVRTTDDVALFSVTEVGRKRAKDQTLKAELKSRVRRMSLCMDRITGSWFPADGVDLISERELPADADDLEALISTMNPQNGEVRELLELENDEAFERFEARTRSPAKLYARVTVSLGEISGLPEVPWRLKEEIYRHAEIDPPSQEARSVPLEGQLSDAFMENITDDSFIVGGPAHLKALQEILAKAKSHVIIHSCFLHPEVLAKLAPAFEAAAERKVRVDLLWGLVVDPEDAKTRQPIDRSIAEIEKLSARGRGRVTLSAKTSTSHLKAIVADSGPDGRWEVVVGSCNFLSSWFDLFELSARVGNPAVVGRIVGQLVDAQLPASGGWSPLVKRLNAVWNDIRRIARSGRTEGTHRIQLILDRDHYAVVRRARDAHVQSIATGCDLFGMAAETTILTPLETAARLGKDVTLYYRRPSVTLTQQVKEPSADELSSRGLKLIQVCNLHGKFLSWGDDAVVVTSFNWLSTAVGARARGAELGLMIEGPGAATLLADKMKLVENAFEVAG